MRRFFMSLAVGLSIAIGGTALAGGTSSWVDFNDETASRVIIADPTLFQTDTNEKDYTKADFDNDGDLDLVIVRKQPYTTVGRRRNVLLMNEGVAEGHPFNGIFVDRTVEFATAATDGGQGFLDLTNDRDVAVGDFNQDGWLDFITVATLSDGLPKTISHPRIFMNRGQIGGVWQGFRYEEARIPQIFTIPGGLAVAPRLCSVAVGDVTGDGFPDIYIGDYDSSGVGGGTPENPANDVNDRLFINDGNGFFTDSLQSRMTSQMLLSAFGVAAHIADMNGDGFMDVVRDTALNFPQHVSISYNNPAQQGFFDDYDVVDDNSPYHISVNDLNNDNRLDIVVTDDGADHYWLNQGNGADGLANFTQFNLQRFGGTDGEFGGNQRVADLNHDGFKDVLIADQDVDIQEQCSRRLHIFRNLGNVPNVTLQEQEGAQPWTHLGTFEIEVMDINGDGWNDLVVGHCAGTNVWMNVPPTSLVFGYPDGLPGQLEPNVQTMFRVSVTGSGTTPQPNTGHQFVSVDGGPFVDTLMPQESPNVYMATLPAVPCTSTVRFYFSATTTTAQVVLEPGNAPGVNYSALASLGTQIIVDERFESANPGWTVTNDPSLTGGAWTRVNPVGTFFPDGSTTPAQPENDASQAASETQCYVTQQYPGSGPSSNSDVDGGPTILTSPAFSLANSDGIVTYARWMFCSDAASPANRDFLVTEVNNGSSGWVQVGQTFDTGGFWEVVSFRVSDFVAPSATVQVRFRVADAGASVTEAGIDNFSVTKLICPIPCVNPGQCDDGLFCNGVETCGVDGFCAAGDDPCPSQICDEDADACVDCLSNAQCDDGLFCNGEEICNAGVCQAGTPPCNAPLTCDEVDDVCVGCSSDAQCDDGSFCNGVEHCVDNVCVGTPDFIGVQNSTFDGATGWTTNALAGATITYPANLQVIGPDGSGGAVAFSSQATVDLSGQNLQFDLLSYTSSDSQAFDRPIFHVDGVNYGLDHDGTLGTPATLTNNAAFGTIRNAQQAANPIHFNIDLEALVGPGPHTIGFGVLSVDGLFGSGTAVFDTVLPAYEAYEQCPGQLCSDELASCVTCLDNAGCDDGQFCNGEEQCVNGACVAGTPPCSVEDCDEVSDTCAAPIQPWLGEPLTGLTAGESARFSAGRAKFAQILEQPQGLGPAFNQNTCAACHSQGALGGTGSIKVTRFGFAHKGGFDDLAEFGGSLLQFSSIGGCAEVVPPEANIVAQRQTTSTFGAGLIEAIADADILANATNPPPGVSGRAHMVPAFEDPNGSPLRVGRFGWKSQVPTVLTFSADASLNEMGLTNRFLTEENDPNGIRPPSLAECDTVPDPEDGPEGGVPGAPHFIDRVTDFQRFLAAPPQTPKSGMTGEGVFNAVGCNACHVRSFTTRTMPESALSNQAIKPYTDFLLHDMGSLGDGIGQGDAGVTEMRTPPLWGLRARNQLLHDGRVAGGTFADRVTGAIAAHVGESLGSAMAFAELTQGEKDALVAFLDSLGRREFDHDGDNDVDGADLAAFTDCYAGSNGTYTADDACAISDVDQDGDVDDDDYALFLTVYSGSQSDCNANSINDATDILVGTSRDCNQNGLPDECDPEPSDINLFVAQLIANSQNPLYICMFDQNDSGTLDGLDIQLFVDALLAP